MRSSLAEVDHLTNVDADCGQRIVSFEVDLDKVDVGVRLHELSYDNEKLKGWSLAKMEAVTEDEAAESDGEEALEEGGTEGEEDA